MIRVAIPIYITFLMSLLVITLVDALGLTNTWKIFAGGSVVPAITYLIDQHQSRKFKREYEQSKFAEGDDND